MSKPVTAEPGAPAAPSASSSTQTHFSWLRTRLSVERTFMSWTRTSVSLIGFGFTIYQFLAKLSRADLRPDAPRNFGLAFIGTGILTMAVGIWQRRLEVAYLDSDEYREIGQRPGLPQWRWSGWVGVVVIVIGVVTGGWIILSP